VVLLTQVAAAVREVCFQHQLHFHQVLHTRLPLVLVALVLCHLLVVVKVMEHLG
jgi:hypothetical protein